VRATCTGGRGVATHLARRIVNVGILWTSEVKTGQHGRAVGDPESDHRHRLDRSSLDDRRFGKLEVFSLAQEARLELVVVHKQSLAFKVVLEHRVAAESCGGRVELFQCADWCWPRCYHVEPVCVGVGVSRSGLV